MEKVDLENRVVERFQEKMDKDNYIYLLGKLCKIASHFDKNITKENRLLDSIIKNYLKQGNVEEMLFCNMHLYISFGYITSYIISNDYLNEKESADLKLCYLKLLNNLYINNRELTKDEMIDLKTIKFLLFNEKPIIELEVKDIWMWRKSNFSIYNNFIHIKSLTNGYSDNEIIRIAIVYARQGNWNSFIELYTFSKVLRRSKLFKDLFEDKKIEELSTINLFSLLLIREGAA